MRAKRLSVALAAAMSLVAGAAFGGNGQPSPWQLGFQQSITPVMDGDGASGEQAAKHLFAFSVLYLFLLFAVLLVEQGIGLPSHALFR
jgi:heme O synthase-like polyprenyltransferase